MSRGLLAPSLYLALLLCSATPSTSQTIPPYAPCLPCGGQPQAEHLLQAAAEVAGYMETYRKLPDTVNVGSWTVNMSQFLWLAEREIRRRYAPASLECVCLDFPPITPVPAYIAIPLNDAFYRKPFSRVEYVAFYQLIHDEFVTAGSFPPSWTLSPMEKIRFCDGVYYAAGILRAAALRRPELPLQWTKYIISTNMLLPWSTPPGYEKYTSALSTDYLAPFGPTSARRYYSSGAHHYETLRQAFDIVRPPTNGYDAAVKIFNWEYAKWWIPGHHYTVGREQFWLEDATARDVGNYALYNSVLPKFVITGLLRSLGVPASNSGAAYWPGHDPCLLTGHGPPSAGWFTIDVHGAWFECPLDNLFFSDTLPPMTWNMPYPSWDHDFIQRIDAISHTPPSPAHLGERRSAWINPKDVLDPSRGPAWVLDHCGNLDTIVLTVKTVDGGLYFNEGGVWPARFEADALGPLLAEADLRGKQVYAAFETLTDRKTCEEHPEWRQKHNEINNELPNGNIDPCVEAYAVTLEALLHKLTLDPRLDGVVLDGIWYANLSTGFDVAGHPDCTSSDWTTIVTDYSRRMVSASRFSNPSVPVVMAAFPLGSLNQYNGLASDDIGNQDLAALTRPQTTGGAGATNILLGFCGTYWVPNATPYWHAAVVDCQGLTGKSPWVSFALVDEWEYDAAFYHGLANDARAQGTGIDGFNLHALQSTAGEFAPAFTETAWGAISLLTFD